MNEWKEYKLRELNCNFLSGYSFKSEDYAVNGIPLIKIGNIQERRVSIEFSNNFIPNYLLKEKTKKFLLENKDILIAMTGQGSVGRVGRLILPNGKKAILNQRVGKFICDEINLNREYLFYILTTDLYQDYLFGAGTGSGQPNLSPEIILNTEIPAPPLAEQKAIAGVLSSLDDKIDLLHRQNKTLEAMAEALFRQWFVEEAGEDWEEKLQLGELVESVSATHKLKEEKIIFLNTSDIYLGRVLSSSYSLVSELPGQAKKSIKKNDILFSEIRPANGRWAFIDFEAKDYVVSTKLMVLRNKGKINQAFIYFYLTNPATTDWLQLLAESRSGTFPQITFDQLNTLKINIPSRDKLINVEAWCSVNLAKILENNRKIQTLEKLRDTLLPKLMSGEVRVAV
ncbi:restriction endonuclease subunit S [Leptospira sp. 'Mane']|uniref:restriction endonuclease subunit S n=1 Tax=Leptospira sp. 'Mane' TaxID=3387407 RepID=UPI00398A7EAA